MHTTRDDWRLFLFCFVLFYCGRCYPHPSRSLNAKARKRILWDICHVKIESYHPDITSGYTGWPYDTPRWHQWLFSAMVIEGHLPKGNNDFSWKFRSCCQGSRSRSRTFAWYSQSSSSSAPNRRRESRRRSGSTNRGWKSARQHRPCRGSLNL